MIIEKKFLSTAIILLCSIILLWFSTSQGGYDNKFEVKPQINEIPEYKSDAARAIDAYERLMNKYLGLTEKNLDRIEVGVETATEKLESINAKLSELSERMAKMEKALGIEKPKPSAQETAPAKNPNSEKL